MLKLKVGSKINVSSKEFTDFAGDAVVLACSKSEILVRLDLGDDYEPEDGDDFVMRFRPNKKGETFTYVSTFPDDAFAGINDVKITAKC